VPAAVAAVLPQLALVVDRAVDAMRDGLRIHYFGAGTSGRVGVQDAAELMPTFALEPGRVVAHHAGGTEALVDALEDVEDDEAAGWRDAADVEAGDVVVGLAASGRTPYVLAALARARTVGAFTVLVSANPDAAAGSLWTPDQRSSPAPPG
jgi:N-acetylmuramic acid 6-phosphate etherase